MRQILFLAVIFAFALPPQVVLGQGDYRLQPKIANEWAQLVLKGINTEFPTKLSLVYSDANQIARPRHHFPAFYGCFDWHSSVHGHWVLVRLLKSYPDLEIAPRIRKELGVHLLADNLRKEADFFARDEQKTFERMYGWAWLLRLATELDAWNDPQGKQWRENIRPLESVLTDRISDYLPRLTYPIRIGQHTDTSFALGQILDYAEAVGDEDLETLVRQRALDFYADDRSFPVEYEPSGHDFFSSCWNEADLMRRVMSQPDFVRWFAIFLPAISKQISDGTIEPVVVSDVTDPKIVHLAGLNLNRAWCLKAVAAALPKEHDIRSKLDRSAKLHLAEGLRYINSGHYEGDHWLATFGLYAIERISVVP